MIRALYLLSALTTALAWALAWRKAEHRPIAILLTVGIVSDLAHRALRVLYLGPAIERLGADRPWEGPERIAGHVSDALFLAWPIAIVGAAVVVFLGQRLWPVLAGYVAALLALVVIHPFAGNGSLARALMTVTLVCLALSIGCAATWYLRSTERTTTAQATLAILLAGELGSLVGSWRLGVFETWHLSQAVYAAMFCIIAFLQGGFLWQSRSS